MYLYRYISFDIFKKVVENKSLYFVNPFECWPDEKEGLLYNAIKTKNKEQFSEISKILSGNENKLAIVKYLEQGGVNIEQKENIDCFGLRFQSWSKAENSEEMWKAYSDGNNSVSIEVESSILLNLEYATNKVSGFCVEYESALSLKTELKKIILYNTDIYDSFILKTKSKEYSFEQEYRLYVGLFDYSNNKYIGKDDEKEGIKVTIDEDISSFISKVYCNPEASCKFKDEVGAYCSKNKLNFIRNDKIGKEDN